MCPRPGVAAERNAHQKQSQTSDEEEEPYEVELLDLLPFGLSVGMQPGEIGRPVEDRCHDDGYAVDNDAQVETPSPCALVGHREGCELAISHRYSFVQMESSTIPMTPPKNDPGMAEQLNSPTTVPRDLLGTISPIHAKASCWAPAPIPCVCQDIGFCGGEEMGFTMKHMPAMTMSTELALVTVLVSSTKKSLIPSRTWKR